MTDMNLRNNLSGPFRYKSFIPTPVEQYRFSADTTLLQDLEKLFGELYAMAQPLPEDEIRQFIRMESDDSWRLADDRPASPFSLAAPSDNVNAVNIFEATLYGMNALEELPVSTRLIRNIHYLICSGPDYDRKYRGEYRNSPVWIGAPGKGLQDADFVPPVADDMTSAITDLENYINYSDENVFVKSAVIHYQFEMIHPFIDGNGRTGRLLNNLFLTDNGVLPSPVLLLSHIILRDYNRYCDTLQYVNLTGDISPWITYWLKTLAESAGYTLRLIKFT